MSAEDIVKFYNSKDFTALELILKELSKESLLDMINQFITSSMNDFGLLVFKAILFGFQHSNSTYEVVVELFKKAFIVLQAKDFNQNFISDVVYVLSNEVGRLNSKSLTDLCEILIIDIKNCTARLEHLIKIFQKLIDILPQHLTVQKDKHIITGVEYRRGILEDLCLYKWQNNTKIHFISMFVDLKLSNAETNIVVEKLLLEIDNTSLSELPPLVFHLLVFASRSNKAQMLIEGIICCVNKLNQAFKCDSGESNALSENSCEINGTILLHIANSLKQNLMLGKDLLKSFKNMKTTLNNQLLSSFYFALSMLLVQDGRFSEDILSCLRTLIFKSLHDAYKRNSHKSLQDRTEEMSSIKDMLLNVAKNCGHGWSHIVGGVVQLGFSLMSMFGPKKGPFGKYFEKIITNCNDPQNEACKIGSDLITISFKSCKIIRKEIVIRLVKCVQGNLNNPAHHYLKLLKSIAKSYPHALLLSSDKLKITFDDLSRMHPNNAQKLFDALIPLLKSNSDLKNNLILILRKTLSSRVESARICALQGFITFLVNFPVTEFSSLSQLSSQSSQSVFSSASFQESAQHSCGPAQNRMLCMEIIQAIKKCLMQQFNVRQCLYNGVCDVVAANPLLSSSIVEVLLDHFSLFYEDDEDVLPPFAVKCCFSKQDGSVQEPLPLLLSTISMIVKESRSRKEEDEDLSFDEDIIQQISSTFLSFSERLCKSEVDDFNLDNSNASSSNCNNTNTLTMVLSLHQVMIEHWITSVNEKEKALDVFQSYKKLYDHCCQNKPNNFDKTLGDVISSSSSLSNLSYALTVLLKDDNSDFSKDEKFIKHIMVVLHNFLVHLCDSGFSLRRDFLKDSLFEQLVIISQLCYHKFMTEKNSCDHCFLLHNYLECFHSATKVVTALYPKKSFHFFMKVSGKDSSQSKDNSLAKLVSQIQRAVIMFSSNSNPLSSDEKKILSELLSLLETFWSVQLMFCKYDDCKQFSTWCQKLCKEYKIEDNSTTKRAISLFLFSSLHTFDYPELPFRDFCTDIHISLDSSEEAEELTSTYKILTPENASLVILILSKHLNSVLADCDWLLSYLKACNCKSEIKTFDTDEAHENRRKIEGSLCVRMCTIGVGLLDLLTADYESAAAIESVIVALTAYFNFLIQICKYYLWLFAQSIGTVPSRFEKLISFIGSELMKPIYAFIMHAQSVQSSKLSKEGKSKKISSSFVAGRAKILRESKSISQLVYSIEQHEHHLILLARKTKIELMKDYHLPTSRDFRIRADVIEINANNEEALKVKEDETNEEESQTINQLDNAIPCSKKRKFNS